MTIESDAAMLGSIDSESPRHSVPVRFLRSPLAWRAFARSSFDRVPRLTYERARARVKRETYVRLSSAALLWRLDPRCAQVVSYELSPHAATMSETDMAGAVERLVLDRDMLRALLKQSTGGGTEAGELINELLAGGMGLGDLSLSLASLLNGNDAVFGEAGGEEWEEEEEDEDSGDAGFGFVLPHLLRDVRSGAHAAAPPSAGRPAAESAGAEGAEKGRKPLAQAELKDPARARVRGAFVHSLLIDSLAEEAAELRRSEEVEPSAAL